MQLIIRLVVHMHSNHCIIYPDRDRATCYVCNIIHHFQISPSSVSPRLSDTKVFPRFLRTVAGEDQIVFALMKLMKQFEWSRIAVITQAENLFTFVSV